MSPLSGGFGVRVGREAPWLGFRGRSQFGQLICSFVALDAGMGRVPLEFNARLPEAVERSSHCWLARGREALGRCANRRLGV